MRRTLATAIVLAAVGLAPDAGTAPATDPPEPGPAIEAVAAVVETSPEAPPAVPAAVPEQAPPELEAEAEAIAPVAPEPAPVLAPAATLEPEPEPVEPPAVTEPEPCPEWIGPGDTETWGAPGRYVEDTLGWAPGTSETTINGWAEGEPEELSFVVTDTSGDHDPLWITVAACGDLYGAVAAEPAR